MRPAHKNLLCYCQQKYEEPHTRFFGMHVCFRARERSPSNGDGRESEHKKNPKTTHKKKPKQTKWGQNSNGRTATSETSQLIALGSALHGSARFCLINLSNLFLFFFVLSPPPSDPFTHTRTHTLHPNHPLSSSLSPLSPHLPLSQTRKNIPEHRCSSHLRGAFTRPIAG